MSSQPIKAALAERRREPDAVLEWIDPGMDVIVGVANGEPAKVMDAIESGAERLHDVRLHQMVPLRSRRYIDGAFPGSLRHVSWFLSPHNRDAFHRGDCDLVPNSFSDVPRLMRQSLAPRLVLTSVSPPDAHGYFSLGANAEYTASFIGEVPFFVEVNPQVPRTFGGNQLHISDVVGYCVADTPIAWARWLRTPSRRRANTMKACRKTRKSRSVPSLNSSVRVTVGGLCAAIMDLHGDLNRIVAAADN